MSFCGGKTNLFIARSEVKVTITELTNNEDDLEDIHEVYLDF